MGYPALYAQPPYHVRDMLPVKFGEPSNAPYTFKVHYPRYSYGGAPPIPQTIWRQPALTTGSKSDVYMAPPPVVPSQFVLADCQNDAYLHRIAPRSAEQGKHLLLPFCHSEPHTNP